MNSFSRWQPPIGKSRLRRSYLFDFVGRFNPSVGIVRDWIVEWEHNAVKPQQTKFYAVTCEQN